MPRNPAQRAETINGSGTPSPTPLLAPFRGLVADSHLTAERCRGLSEPNARLITIGELDAGRLKGAL